MCACDYYHLPMEKEKPKILVRDVLTEQVLYSTALEDAEKAYAYAAHLEELGLDVAVIHPTLSETLTSSLGLSKEETSEYMKSMDEEIEAHEGSCCFEEKLH